MDQEVVFLYKMRGNSSPKDKPRVYFTCHPDDFERYFEKVCEDIFKTHDCAIYYTDDMTADLLSANNRADLERMNLFVIPVTYRLLTKQNRAMDSDFRFAIERHIPVLPIMMESGIDQYYGKSDKFGDLQYLDPFNHDITAISYEEKLKKYLEAVLISDELAQRVRKAFDAYIFLSYRKKDRRYANELMKLIHKNPECRDIAIWFDEFLTPGESFKENIDRILQNSELFTLLVTPSLLEKNDGKPNYVMGEEYPAAKDSGKEILPAEMEETDREALSSSFMDIPDCVNAHNDENFRERLLESLKKVATPENRNDPEHNYLIGLAYLEGIDVERDPERGTVLINCAAEAGLIQAMEKMVEIYDTGTGRDFDLSEAVKWKRKVINYYSGGHDVAKVISLYEDLADLLEMQNDSYAGKYYFYAVEYYIMNANNDLKSLVELLRGVAKWTKHQAMNERKLLIPIFVKEILSKLKIPNPINYNVDNAEYVKMFYYLSILYRSSGDSEKEYTCLRQAEQQISEGVIFDEEYLEVQSNVYIHLGWYYGNINKDKKKAIYYLKRSIKVLTQKLESARPRDKILRIKNIIEGYRNITILIDQSQFQQIYELYSEVFQFVEKYNVSTLNYIGKEIGDLYNDYGLFLKSLDYKIEAKESFLSAIEVYNMNVESNPSIFEPCLAVCYFNYALCVLHFLRQPYLKKAYSLAKQHPTNLTCQQILVLLKDYNFDID